jgi:hypothetical protein
MTDPNGARRPSARRRRERLVALVLVGFLVLNYPLLHLVDQDRSWFGVPLLYLYLFLAWALLILLVALVLEAGQRRERRQGE